MKQLRYNLLFVPGHMTGKPPDIDLPPPPVPPPQESPSPRKKGKIYQESPVRDSGGFIFFYFFFTFTAVNL